MSYLLRSFIKMKSTSSASPAQITVTTSDKKSSSTDGLDSVVTFRHSATEARYYSVDKSL